MPAAIHARGLTKQFPRPDQLVGFPLPFLDRKGTLAVNKIDLDVEHGEVFGLVGPNGAGKTTLVKMLATLILPTSGTATVGGYRLCSENERRIKASVGLVTGNQRSFYPRLSCSENLRFYAGLHNLSPAKVRQRTAELASLLNLDDFLDKRYDTCSTGMKHRLALARSLINNPQLLFLDEPTRSLDPLAAARFRQAIYALAHHRRRTVFLVTHDVDEAVELCDRVGVMLHGQLRLLEEPESLRRLLKSEETYLLQIRGFNPEMSNALRQVDAVRELTAEVSPECVASLSLQLENPKQTLPIVMRIIAENGGTVEKSGSEATSWEKIFDTLESVPPQHTSELTGAAAAENHKATPKEQRSRSGAKGFVRRSLPEAFRKSLSKPLLFFHRDLKTHISYRMSFVLQFLGIIFSSASFYFVAQLMGQNAAPLLSGYGGDYFSFVLIGIAFLGYQGVALNSFSNVIRSAQSMGTLEAMLVTPTHLSTILFSSSLWSFMFTSLRAIVYLLGGTILFGADLRQANLVAGIGILCLTVLTLSSIGILSASFIMIFKRGSPINFLIGSLSSLLAGVYYPLEVLPDWLQSLARVFPLTYSLEAMRRALLAGEDLIQLARPIIVLAAFAIVLLPLSLVAFRLAVQQAKRDGSLTHF